MTVHMRADCSSSALLSPLITPSSLQSVSSSPKSTTLTLTHRASSVSTSSNTNGLQPTPSRKCCSPSPVSFRMPTTKTPSCLKSRSCSRKARASSQQWQRSGRKNMRNDINTACLTTLLKRNENVCNLWKLIEDMGHLMDFFNVDKNKNKIGQGNIQVNNYISAICCLRTYPFNKLFNTYSLILFINDREDFLLWSDHPLGRAFTLRLQKRDQNPQEISQSEGS